MTPSTATTRKTAKKEPQWLSLGPAAQILGVSEETLRHWADAGRIHAYRTPGAHRRFAREDLLLLQSTGRPHLPQDMEDETLQRLRRRLRNTHRAQVIPDSLNEDARDHLRVLGRRLVELALRYHSDKHRRTAIREEAKFVGQGYGTESLSMGLSLPQTVESFLYHRNALIDTVRSMVPGGSLPDDALDLWRDVGDLVDIALQAIVQFYDDSSAIGSRSGTEISQAAPS